MSNLLAIQWNVDPVLVSLGGFELRYYSLCFLVAFVLGYVILFKMFKKEGIKSDYLDSLVVYIFFAVLIGARLGHCLFYQPDYFCTKEHWIEIILPIEKQFVMENGHLTSKWALVGYQGLASHGAAIGILVALGLFYRKFRMNPWWILDRLAIVVALGGAFVRLGNLFNSEIYGVETTLPWGVVFLQNNETVPKHPTQIYEALSYFLIFIVSIWVYVKKQGKLRTGTLFGWWLVALFGARFIIEFVKETQVGFEEGMTLYMGQWLSIPFICFGLAMVILSHKNKIAQEPFVKQNK